MSFADALDARWVMCLRRRIVKKDLPAARRALADLGWEIATAGPVRLFGQCYTPPAVRAPAAAQSDVER